MRLREDGETLAVRCALDEREARLAPAPEAFFITEHDRRYPAVCVRLSTVKLKDLQSVLESAWRGEAGRKLVEARRGKPVGKARAAAARAGRSGPSRSRRGGSDA